MFQNVCVSGCLEYARVQFSPEFDWNFEQSEFILDGSSRLPLSTSGGEIISRICPIKYSEIFISGICWFYLSRICPEFFMYKKTGQTLDMKKFRTTKVAN
ncbi:unnamed protein product [Rhizophagus irregularis]|nr:unnamed protein product [Rhizophagus irregularis]